MDRPRVRHRLRQRLPPRSHGKIGVLHLYDDTPCRKALLYEALRYSSGVFEEGPLDRASPEEIVLVGLLRADGLGRALRVDAARVLSLGQRMHGDPPRAERSFEHRE